ncbi:hypothetical protein Mapa_007540 [Marchantia paleacea]|nr:hypothetical protein Mapa_007540 [Marchantia paleacea]
MPRMLSVGNKSSWNVSFVAPSYMSKSAGRWITDFSLSPAHRRTQCCAQIPTPLAKTVGRVDRTAASDLAGREHLNKQLLVTLSTAVDRGDFISSHLHDRRKLSICNCSSAFG